MPGEVNAPEKVQIVVESKSILSGLNATLALLKALEQQAGRTSTVLGRLGGAGHADPSRAIAGIKDQIAAFQKSGQALTPVNLAKLFQLRLDPADLERQVRGFAAELKSHGSRFGRIFEGQSRLVPLPERAFKTPENASEFVTSVTHDQRRAGDQMRGFEQQSQPAHVSPQNLAAAAVRFTPAPVTLSHVAQGELPRVPESIVPRAMAEKVRTIGEERHWGVSKELTEGCRVPCWRSGKSVARGRGRCVVSLNESGHRGEALFWDDADRQRFLGAVAELPVWQGARKPVHYRQLGGR